MTPSGQMDLPWTVMGGSHALRGLAEAIGRLEDVLERGDPRAMLENENQQGGIVTLGVLLPADREHLRPLRMMVLVHIDVLRNTGFDPASTMTPQTVVEHTLRICGLLARSPRVEPMDDADPDMISAAVLELIEIEGSEGRGPHFGHHFAATPLGTGGLMLDVGEGWMPHPSPAWAVPGPVEIELSGPLPGDDFETRDEMRIAAFERIHIVEHLDTVGRLRLHARIAAKRAGDTA